MNSLHRQIISKRITDEEIAQNIHGPIDLRYFKLIVHMSRTNLVKYIITHQYFDISTLSRSDIVEFIINLDISSLKFRDLVSHIPINWCEFIFMLGVSLTLYRTIDGYINVNGILEFIDNYDNYVTTTYKNTTIISIKNIRPPIGNIYRQINLDEITHQVKGYTLLITKHNITTIADTDITDRGDNILECLDIIGKSVLPKLDPVIKLSMLKLLNYYTNHETFEEIKEFYNDPDGLDNKDMVNNVNTINNICWDIVLRYRKLSSHMCENLSLYHGISNQDNLPIYPGSIINKFKNRFQSFTSDLNIAKSFATGSSKIIITLVCNLSSNIVLPIANLNINKKYLAIYEYEMEFLLPLHTTLVILRKPFLTADGYTIITCGISSQTNSNYKIYSKSELENEYGMPVEY